MTTESKKRLALAIIDFLSTCANDGTFPADEKDTIEVAQTCIAESFGVNPDDKAAMEDAVGGQSLLSIYGVYEKLKGRGQKPPSQTSSSTAAAVPPSGPTPAQKQEAEALKGQGNAAMSKKDYATAISFYTKALEITPQNPIYLSNRAAAYSASQKHEQAMVDAQAAVEVDPKYTKAWSRLGLAKFALGDAKGSMEAYQKGIDYEGNGGSEAMRKGYETAKKRVEEDAESDDIGGSARGAGAPGGFGGMPDLSGLASMLGGGAGGAGGGTPDLSSLMNNPMFSSAAQSLMSNPELMSSLMSNPRLREMAESFGGGGSAGGRGGGGMPDLASLMSDPSIAEMAKNIMGPGAGRGRGGGGGAGGAKP